LTGEAPLLYEEMSGDSAFMELPRVRWRRDPIVLGEVATFVEGAFRIYAISARVEAVFKANIIHQSLYGPMKKEDIHS